MKLLELLSDMLKEDSYKCKYKFISNNFEINRISLKKNNKPRVLEIMMNYNYLRDNFISKHKVRYVGLIPNRAMKSTCRSVTKVNYEFVSVSLN